MNPIKFLSCALLVLGAALGANAQETATPQSKGEYLARAGDCVSCHSVAGGKAFAGGLRMGTPMGAIYSTNITPDPDTGISTIDQHRSPGAFALLVLAACTAKPRRLGEG
jgi:hypothetical protein